MRFLSSRREKQIISHIEQAHLAHVLELQVRDELIVAKDEFIVAAGRHIAELQDALKNAIRLQREIVQAFLLSRENSEAEIVLDLEGMMETLNDQIAILDEHMA